MKYAIILETEDSKYLLGFTNTIIDETTGRGSFKYTVELKEIEDMFIPLKGDAAVYLS